MLTSSRRYVSLAALLCFLLFLISCAEERSSEATSFDVQSYELHAQLDWTTKTIQARENITLVLGYPARSQNVELDSHVNATRVYSGDKQLPFSARTDKLQVDLSSVAGTSPITFTIEYSASASGALIFSGPRDDDPVKSRIVYTDSEPDRASSWIVGKMDPSDRALFSIELTVPSEEDVVSNGARLSDSIVNGNRVVRYALDKPIPMYLMAFAAGQIEHVEKSDGRIPLALWFRQGLKVDTTAHFKVITDAMTSFETLLGPYPWDSYAVVLLPQYGGGMENATITFNSELSGQGNVNLGLNAHELAHQWFGDWVTMNTYNDVWVKEGMATLLASEATRASRDAEHKGRLFGRDFSFDPDDAVLDESLPPRAKYTSGPYARAAWMLTQIRAKVGEQAFWASSRKVLSDHALGSISSEAFVRSFSPALDEASIQKMLRAIRTKQVPHIDVTSANGASATNVSLSVSDPGKTLLTPFSVHVIGADGHVQEHVLNEQATLNVVVPSDGYIALDENDVHPDWIDSFAISQEDYSSLSSRFLPPTPSVRTVWGGRSAAHQERTLLRRGINDVLPAEFTTFYNSIDSTLAKQRAVFSACDKIKASGNEAIWTSSLTPFLQMPAMVAFSSNYADCGTILPTQVLKDEFETLSDTLPTNSLGRIEYLLSFDYGAAQSLALIGKVAITAPSLDLRDQAIIRLSLQVSGVYSSIPVLEQGAWRDFFRARLAEVTSANRFFSVWLVETLLVDVAALPIVAQALHRVPLSSQVQRSTICDAFRIASDNTNAWVEFQEAVQPWSTLSSDAVSVLGDPALCS